MSFNFFFFSYPQKYFKFLELWSFGETVHAGGGGGGGFKKQDRRRAGDVANAPFLNSGSCLTQN